MTDITEIKFLDLKKRDDKERERLKHRQKDLESLSRPLSNEEQRELDRITEINNYLTDPDVPELVDPLYIAVKDFLNDDKKTGSLTKLKLRNHQDGVLKFCDETLIQLAEKNFAVAEKKYFEANGKLIEAADDLVSAETAFNNAGDEVDRLNTELEKLHKDIRRLKKRIANTTGAEKKRAREHLHAAEEDAEKCEAELTTAVETKSDAESNKDQAEYVKQQAQAETLKAELEKNKAKAVLDSANSQAVASASDIVRISLVLGLLATDNVVAPRVRFNHTDKVGDEQIISDSSDPRYDDFSKVLFSALGEEQSVHDLSMLVLPILEREGDSNLTDSESGQVDTVEYARVLRCLRSDGIDENNEPQLRRHINHCLDKIQHVGAEKAFSDIGIALPDLNEVTDYEIQAENVRLMGPIICGAMFEELKAFQVLDKLAELSQNGMLPIGRGEAGELLYRYWKDTPNRMSENERRDLYAITIGIPGGSANGMTNRDFNDLWIRFVSAVSSLVRQRTTDSVLRAKVPVGVSQQQARKAARDLSLNLSSHGYGMTLYRALELQELIRTVIKLLSDKEILSAYGAKDMWQVIDQVGTLELGGARNSARYRTLATAGAIITAWLANNVSRFNRATSSPIIDVDDVISSYPESAGSQATTEPKDYDLVNACELWLADTAVSDDRVEEMAQPREAPMMTSKPIQIPSIAREMLEQAGIPDIGYGMGSYRQ